MDPDRVFFYADIVYQSTTFALTVLRQLFISMGFPSKKVSFPL